MLGGFCINMLLARWEHFGGHFTEIYGNTGISIILHFIHLFLQLSRSYLLEITDAVISAVYYDLYDSTNFVCFFTSRSDILTTDLYFELSMC